MKILENLVIAGEYKTPAITLLQRKYFIKWRIVIDRWNKFKELSKSNSLIDELNKIQSEAYESFKLLPEELKEYFMVYDLSTSNP